ncbi:MAG: HAD family hydrolase [Spirochaetota bacterium]
MTLKAIAFDIDGTLYPNRSMYLRSIPFALRNIRLMREFRRVRKELRAIRPIHDFYETQAQYVADGLGQSYAVARERIDRLIYGEWEQVLRSVKVYAGVRDFIARLAGSTVKIGVMSDFPVHNKLEILGLSGLWDAEVAAETTGYLKPAAEPFIVLSGQLGVNPDETLYVGNSYHYDVIGASRAGMFTAHLDPRTRSKAELVHTQITSSTEGEVKPNIRFRTYEALEKLILPYISH